MRHQLKPLSDLRTELKLVCNGHTECIRISTLTTKDRQKKMKRSTFIFFFSYQHDFAAVFSLAFELHFSLAAFFSRYIAYVASRAAIRGAQ